MSSPKTLRQLTRNCHTSYHAYAAWQYALQLWLLLNTAYGCKRADCNCKAPAMKIIGDANRNVYHPLLSDTAQNQRTDVKQGATLKKEQKIGTQWLVHKNT